MIYLFSFAPSSHLNALSDLSNGMKNEDENIVWKQSAMQKDAARLKIQRQAIFEKFRMAPNSPSLPSFMLDAPQVDQLHAYILTKFVGFPIVVACMHSCFRRHSRRQTTRLLDRSALALQSHGRRRTSHPHHQPADVWKYDGQTGLIACAAKSQDCGVGRICQ